MSSMNLSGDVDWSTISESTRSDRVLFMFVRRDDGCYMIYKFDAHLFAPPQSTIHDISPLVIFKKGVLPDCVCSFVYISPYFYIVGAQKDDVFIIDKNILIRLEPSEKRRGSKLVEPANAMSSNKNLSSLAFAYKNNLYVISSYICPMLPKHQNHEFEVYSPLSKFWRPLGNSPLSHRFSTLYIQSHLIVATVVYFTTSCHVVMSFDLDTETWMTVFDPYQVRSRGPTYVPPHPTFKSQTIVVGNTIFGLFERRGADYDDVCASSSLEPSDDFFLRPNLAPDQPFVINSLTPPIDFVTDLPDWSQFIFAWDEDILCVVIYGRDLMTHAYELVNYAQLSFFKISADSYQCPININSLPPGCSDGREFFYAREGDQVNYFKAQFVGLSRLFIKTRMQFTHGTPCSCIFVDH